MASPATAVGESSFLVRHKGELSFLTALTGLAGVTCIQHLFPSEFPALVLVLQHGFEAATVGGAADWLAVKMIFDEIKIGNVRIVPASGIIPRKQKTIARGAGQLVAKEWLSAESVTHALQDFDFAGALTDYVEERPDWVDRQIDNILRLASEWLSDEANVRQIADWIGKSGSGIRLSKLLANSVGDDGVARALHSVIPSVADALREGLASPEVHRIVLEKMQAEQKGFFRQLFFDPEEATEKTLLKAMEFLREVQEQEDHPIRIRIVSAAVSWLDAVRRDPSRSTKLDDAVSELVATPENAATWFADGVRQWVDRQRDRSASALRDFVRHLSNYLMGKLRSDWNIPFNRRVRSMIGDLLARHHDEIARIVEDNLNQLSPDQIKEQFKARTYDDMQWIRVNGAVAGFFIGLIIGIVRSFL